MLALVLGSPLLAGCSSGASLDYDGSDSDIVSACTAVATSQDRSDPAIPNAIRTFDVERTQVSVGLDVDPLVYTVTGSTEVTYADYPKEVFTWACEAQLSPTAGTLVASLKKFEEQ
jgi:hypothetical protein